MKRKKDVVNHPPHYNQAGVECIHAIEAATGEGFEYYLQGKKAQWYLNKLIEIKEK